MKFPELLLGFLLATAMFAIGLITPVPSHQENLLLEFLIKLLTDPVGMFTAVLAVSTIGLWGATYQASLASDNPRKQKSCNVPTSPSTREVFTK